MKTATDLAHHIQTMPLADTHDHQATEGDYVERGPDVLQDLFQNYVTADLTVAGASPQALGRLLNAKDPDLGTRFRGVQEAWARSRHTGYGEAVRLIAKHVYGMNEITPAGLEAARERNLQLRRPGERLRILRDVARLDHVQIDHWCWPCQPDASGPGFFLYDLSWAGFCGGQLGTKNTPDSAKTIHDETGVEVTSIASLRQAMQALFAKYAPCAVAVKAQHAYNRTLHWQERTDADTDRVLQKKLRGEPFTEDERLCLGDWGWARGVELAIEHNLPFKIHTGYYAGHSSFNPDYIRSGLLAPILKKYPRARFVLMHAAYPYTDELVAVAKSFPNAYVDLCWGWSIDPFTTCDFVRRMIHAAPANKLFAFGADTRWPNAAVAYAIQARRWLTRALQAEVDDGFMTEHEAFTFATRVMLANQEECFNLAAKRAAVAAKFKQAAR